MVGSRAAAHLDRGRPDWTVMDGLGQGLGKPCPEVLRAPHWRVKRAGSEVFLLEARGHLAEV